MNLFKGRIGSNWEIFQKVGLFIESDWYRTYIEIDCLHSSAITFLNYWKGNPISEAGCGHLYSIFMGEIRPMEGVYRICLYKESYCRILTVKFFNLHLKFKMLNLSILLIFFLLNNSRIKNNYLPIFSKINMYYKNNQNFQLAFEEF